MRAYTLALVLCLPLLSFAAGCSNEGDYAVAVSWLINGAAPDSAMCQEQGATRARFEVRARGEKTQVLEVDCASTIERWVEEIQDYAPYGGFISKPSFQWGVQYQYTLSLIDAAGNPVSPPGTGEFFLRYDEGEIYELDYLDWLQIEGSSASVRGEWLLGVGDLATECQTQRVASVEVVAFSALDVAFSQGVTVPGTKVPCASGAVRTNGAVLASGYYQFKYVGRSENGIIVTESDPSAPAFVGVEELALPRLPLLPVVR